MTAEITDVIIVGAGLSGIGSACHLQQKCPDKHYLILEGRESVGGTWDLFRYPGIRSDSDMHTLGYEFKPWRAQKAIADGPAILDYIKEAAAEHQVGEHIRYQHQVRKADWSSDEHLWTLEVTDSKTAAVKKFKCNFLLMCAGYYDYKGGYEPQISGRADFQGDIVHPQEWPEDLGYGDKNIVVIGSGATAVTLIPELAKEAKHVVMLQRSPTYMASMPDTDRIANFLRKVLPEKWAYTVTRWKNVKLQQIVYYSTRVAPKFIKRKLIKRVRKELGENADIEKNFTPLYDPWDQRLCLVPNGDLFESLRSGRASVITDKISAITASGIRLESGREVGADIIVTATGLSLCLLGDVQVSVDGESVNFAEKYSYKAMMFSDVPNLVSIFGYINASWTLRADLVADYACRLINHMTIANSRQCTPRLRGRYRDMNAKPWIENFSSNYIQRKQHLLPRQGDRHPWLNTQNYSMEKKLIRDSDVVDDVLEFLG
ncbi:MAG: flavin-containing monooxygenase [Woeseiaceae bacterium]